MGIAIGAIVCLKHEKYGLEEAQRTYRFYFIEKSEKYGECKDAADQWIIKHGHKECIVKK